MARRRNLDAELRHLERAYPAIRDAARRYDEMRAKITAQPMTDDERRATAAYWLTRGLRAMAGIEPIRTERRN